MTKGSSRRLVELYCTAMMYASVHFKIINVSSFICFYKIRVFRSTSRLREWESVAIFARYFAKYVYILSVDYSMSSLFIKTFNSKRVIFCHNNFFCTGQNIFHTGWKYFPTSVRKLLHVFRRRFYIMFTFRYRNKQSVLSIILIFPLDMRMNILDVSST